MADPRFVMLLLLILWPIQEETKLPDVQFIIR